MNIQIYVKKWKDKWRLKKNNFLMKILILKFNEKILMIMRKLKIKILDNYNKENLQQ